MTHVVTESCFKCDALPCTTVCPVDCFHAGDNFVVIDPKRCIDCAVCVAECPVHAIVEDTALPPSQQAYSQLNAERAREWPPLPAA